MNFELFVHDLKDEIIFKVFDKEPFLIPEAAIGYSCTKFSALCINGGGEFDLDLFFNEDIVGTLTVLAKYTPLQEMSCSYDTIALEQDIEKVEKDNTYMQQEIANLDKGIAKRQQSIKSKKERLTEYTESI